eukprot:1178582-Prorocentrum_minimum.AAC.1
MEDLHAAQSLEITICLHTTLRSTYPTRLTLVVGVAPNDFNRNCKNYANYASLCRAGHLGQKSGGNLNSPVASLCNKGLTCVCLAQGVRIAPKEAPSTGYMFGKGVYFADVASKSAQYCGATRAQPEGLLLVCEVALGRTHDVRRAEYMEAPPRARHSTRALGKYMPDPAVCNAPRDDGVTKTKITGSNWKIESTYEPKQCSLIDLHENDPSSER